MNNLEKSRSKKKPHAIRATFSLPSETIEDIEGLRQKFAKDGHILNRSELIRVGLAALDTLSERSARKLISEIERLKAGRPKSFLNE